MYISVSYFAGILVSLVWFLPGWVRCYELLCVHMRYLPLFGLQVGCSGTVFETLLSYCTMLGYLITSDHQFYNIRVLDQF
jgi:hypothetical protein